MIVAAEFHGIHAAPTQEDCLSIRWGQAGARNVRIRVRDHTCACTEPSYELCQAGGLLSVRRISRDVIDESPWMAAGEGLRLWQMLLTGRAR